MSKLVRKNEYECCHCSACGYIVPDRILIGNWPEHIYKIRFCPNCGEVFDNVGENTSPELKSGWYWEMHSFDEAAQAGEGRQ
jgi:ribosomal protein S27AE